MVPVLFVFSILLGGVLLYAESSRIARRWIVERSESGQWTVNLILVLVDPVCYRILVPRDLTSLLFQFVYHVYLESELTQYLNFLLIVVNLLQTRLNIPSK